MVAYLTVQQAEPGPADGTSQTAGASVGCQACANDQPSVVRFRD
jgi:hypothetical protein